MKQRLRTFFGPERAPPERREDPVRPVVGGDVEAAEHLRRRDRLRVHAHLPAIGGRNY